MVPVEPFTSRLMLFSVTCMRSTSSSPSPLRILAVSLAVTAAVAGAAWSLGTALRDTAGLVLAPGRTSVEELVVAASAAAALVLLLWVALGLLTSVLAALPGPLGGMSRRMRDSIAPETVRRCAGLLLGMAVASACAPGGAVAHEVASIRVVDAVDAVGAESAAVPLPLWADDVPLPPLPEWTPTPVRAMPPVSLTASRPPAVEERAEVVVRRGDTLWDLAAARLSPDAGDAEIARAWQAWWAQNRLVIGPDPDLILPGQVLVVPTLAATLAGDSR